ncbi:MAG: PadR family transcriptional regulator [Halobacteriota archaeon]|nr:PadR family transcriptional regulator [Halobacteriota archaeon]MDY6930998.1 PadR family transcriptional regulator [Halobacteriota archaeon]
MDETILKFKDKLNKELRSGLYSLLILLAMDHIKEPTYGYQIGQTIDKLSDGKFVLKDATIYPLLRNFQKKKLIEGFWAEPTKGPVRKYYSLTEAGEEALKIGLNEWNDLVFTTQSIIGHMKEKE